MKSLRLIASVGAIAAIAAASGTAMSQDYPSKPIRIITPFGGADFTSRLIAQGLSGLIGQQVVVDNRPSVLVGEVAAKAPADGYNLVVTASFLWLSPLLQQTAYDPIRDFAPVTMIARSPNLLVVHPALPLKTVKDLISLAKAKPGQLNFSTGESGSGTHLALELFKSMSGADLMRIPYKGGGTEASDLISGYLQGTVGTIGTVGPYVKSGKLRALAVTSVQPFPVYPQLPTVAATVPGYEWSAIYGLFVPAKTPTAIVNRINQEVVGVLNTPDVKEKFLNTGFEVVGSQPDQFASVIKNDMARIAKLIKDRGIKPD